MCSSLIARSLCVFFALLTKVCYGQSGAKKGAIMYLSHLSHKNTTSTDIVEFDSGSTETVPQQEWLNGKEFSSYSDSPKFQANLARYTQNFRMNSGNCLFHSLPHPEFPEFLVEWKAPFSTRTKATIKVGPSASLQPILPCPNFSWSPCLESSLAQETTKFIQLARNMPKELLSITGRKKRIFQNSKFGANLWQMPHLLNFAQV